MMNSYNSGALRAGRPNEAELDVAWTDEAVQQRIDKGDDPIGIATAALQAIKDGHPRPAGLAGRILRLVWGIDQ